MRRLRRLSPLLLATTLTLAQSARADCPTRATWPTEDWPDAREEVAAVRAAQLKALEEERKGVRTDGVLLIHKGRLVYERYGRGFDASKRHLA